MATQKSQEFSGFILNSGAGALTPEFPPSEALVESGIAEGDGKLDVLINNAGILREGPMLPSLQTVNIIRQVCETNVFGVIRVMQAFLPVLKAAGQANVERGPNSGSMATATRDFMDLTWQVSPDLLGALNSEGYFETSNPAWKTVLRTRDGAALSQSQKMEARREVDLL